MNVNEIKSLIEKIESAGDKVLTKDDIITILKTGNIKDRFLYFTVFNCVESNEHGEIKLKDFLSLLKKSPNEADFMRNLCKNIIKTWDRNGDGQLDINEFRKFLQLFDDNYKYKLFDAELKESFDEIDKNKDGFISLEELEKYIKKMGSLEREEQKQLEKKYADAKKRFEKMDKDKDGLIDYEEYKKYENSVEFENDEYYKPLFDQIDKDKDGKISFIDWRNDMEEIIKAMTDCAKKVISEELLAESMIKECCQQIFNKSDLNKDGFVDFEEFRQSEINMSLNPAASEEESRAEFDLIDDNKDGKLSFDEVFKFFKNYYLVKD